MLGRRTQCTWPELGRGSTQSISAWRTFMSTSIDQRMLMLNNIRGEKVMYSTIQGIISNIQMQFGPSTHKWIGLFTPWMC